MDCGNKQFILKLMYEVYVMLKKLKINIIYRYNT